MSDDFGQFQDFLRRGPQRSPKLYAPGFQPATPIPPKPKTLPPPAGPAGSPPVVPPDFKSRAAGDSEDEMAEEVVDESERPEDF
jgi:hypothetical protein